MDPTAEDLQVKGRDHVGSEVQLSVTDTPFSPVHKASDDSFPCIPLLQAL